MEGFIVALRWYTIRYMQFEFLEDKIYFANLLAEGDVARLEHEFTELFDFRDPKTKRSEYSLMRSSLYEKLFKKYRGECQLKLHKDCSREKVFQIDHVIPLSTNVLNKLLRKMRPSSSKKVPSQSFGSNNEKNLILACKCCNAFKKHRILLPKVII